MIMRILLPLLALLTISPLQAMEQNSQHVRFVVDTLTHGLNHPWGLAFLPDGDLLITERSGALRRFSEGKLMPIPIKGVPDVVVDGQGGLLDIALHPAFADNRLVYLSYANACPDGGKATAVGRGEYKEGALFEFHTLFHSNSCASGGHHFGGRLLFDERGYLYLTIGDRGDRHRSQNFTDHVGAILRLHDDGRVPQDNPFANEADVDDAIWSIGHRNPQGIVMHPLSKQIWSHEHGPRGGDEINLIRPGVNYGWPKVTFGREYYGPRIGVTDKPGMEPPLKHWTPSIAPSGMAFYYGEAFPQWQGDMFVGALAGQHIARVRFDGLKPVEEEQLLKGMARFRDVRVGPDGLIYLLTDSPNGALLRLRPL